jgi:hypothetical protein
LGMKRQQSAIGIGNPETDRGNLHIESSNSELAIMAVPESVVGA